MNYRILGKTGLSVSEIGYGGEHITDADYKTTEEITQRRFFTLLLTGESTYLMFLCPSPVCVKTWAGRLRVSART